MKCGGAINEGDICVQSQRKPYDRFYHPDCTTHCQEGSSRISKTVKDKERTQNYH